jgi:hypothetical protein
MDCVFLSDDGADSYDEDVFVLKSVANMIGYIKELLE